MYPMELFSRSICYVSFTENFRSNIKIQVCLFNGTRLKTIFQRKPEILATLPVTFLWLQKMQIQQHDNMMYQFQFPLRF